jgi:O-antigen ligase
LIALAYYGVGSILFWLSAAILVAVGLGRTAALRLRLLDCAVLAVGTYEIPSLTMSRYSANSVAAARVVCAAALLYFLARLAARTAHGIVVVSALVGAGGIALGWTALSQFGEHASALRAAGLSGIVAFRSRLILVPAPWILGEWFTLVLLTLPFALAVAAFFWLGRNRIAAVGAALFTLAIAAALLLSCSRAVAGGVLVLFGSISVLAAAYRVMRIKAALILTAGALCALGCVLTAENALYPGIAEAYTGRHTSQVRSTEGRLAIWKRSADVFRLSPLWGVGSGNAPLFLTSTADQEETTGFASRTYSLPIQLLTEKGALGAALYLALLVMAGAAAHRKLRSPNTSAQMKGMTCCLAGGAIAVLFRELTYSSLLEHAATAMLFAMCLALIAAEEPA